MPKKKCIALIAHDNLKPGLVTWAQAHIKGLRKCNLIATGTTGKLLREELKLPVHRYKSGPLGGDLQIGARIAEGRVDYVIFFWDPLGSHSHDVDVKALLRIAAVYDVPIACNRATANLMMATL